MARIPYAPSANPGSEHPLNLFRMLAHSPPVLSGFARLGGALLQDAALDPRLREIAIVRIGHLAAASYEVDKHTAIARAVGVTEADLTALRSTEGRAALGDAARAVIELTDELFAGVRASDAALARVRQHLDDRQLVELVVTIGYYGLVCRVLETLAVDPEEVVS
jgi:4-carboxymuconolactone decarboxylase